MDIHNKYKYLLFFFVFSPLQIHSLDIYGGLGLVYLQNEINPVISIEIDYRNICFSYNTFIYNNIYNNDFQIGLRYRNIVCFCGINENIYDNYETERYHYSSYTISFGIKGFYKLLYLSNMYVYICLELSYNNFGIEIIRTSEVNINTFDKKEVQIKTILFLLKELQ